jgi:uncharacterized RDD family membrane protein YckC
MAFYVILFLVLMLPAAIVVVRFLIYLITGKNNFTGSLLFCELICIVITPYIFLNFFDIGKPNDCCYDSAVFSPEHRLSVYIFIIVCVVAYFYSRFRKAIAPPIIECLINAALTGGIVLNIFISIQIDEGLWLLGNLPIIILFILMLIRNHYLFIETTTEQQNEHSAIERLALKVLTLKLFQKVPLLLLACLPIMVIVVAFLLLFGQKPDSLVRAFTDTYKHGFSELDYQCNGVVCGGHYLCTVAAKGHISFVKPVRGGIRGNQKIICNRQLLISNAFEELIEQRFPNTHKRIRNSYDNVGAFVERHYWIFNYKLICDCVYILMKPLEWFFLLVLYTFDKHPENRIASQYLSRTHRNELRRLSK